jgi:hypothetical protein
MDRNPLGCGRSWVVIVGASCPRRLIHLCQFLVNLWLHRDPFDTLTSVLGTPFMIFEVARKNCHLLALEIRKHQKVLESMIILDVRCVRADCSFLTFNNVMKLSAGLLEGVDASSELIPR